MSAFNVPLDDVGESNYSERGVYSRRIANKRSGKPCSFPGCGCLVRNHFDETEDPTRRCSIPGCPCTGYQEPR